MGGIGVDDEGRDGGDDEEEEHEDGGGEDALVGPGEEGDAAPFGGGRAKFQPR